jgi:hypothetical protein
LACINAAVIGITAIVLGWFATLLAKHVTIALSQAAAGDSEATAQILGAGTYAHWSVSCDMGAIGIAVVVGLAR